MHNNTSNVHSKSIHSKFVQKMIFIVLISIGLWYLAFVYGEYSTFRSESASLRVKYLKSQKIMLQSQVTNVVDFINNMKKFADERLKTDIRERVNQAYETAMNIYKQNVALRTVPEIKNMIKDALYSIRFDNGTGYYFAVSMDGIVRLYPVRPALEGKNVINLQDAKGNFPIKDEIKMIKEKKQGFVKDFWPVPGRDPSTTVPKMSFIKYFKPLSWYIGTGAYYKDYTKRIKNNILHYLADLKFGQEGYFFGNTYQGDSIFSNGKINIGSENLWNLRHPKGKKVIQEMIKIVKNHGRGFVNYSWDKLNSSTLSPKISFVAGIPEWQWVIGAGVYLDTVDKIIAEKRAALNNKFKQGLIRGIFIMLLLFCLIYFWSRRFANQIFESFDTCVLNLKQAGAGSAGVDIENIPLKEFKDIAVSMNQILEKRNRAQRKLQESEERYRSIFENAVEGFFQRTPEERFIDVNPAFAHMLGYSSPREFISAVSDLENQLYVNPGDRHRYEKIIRKNGYIKNFELQAKRKDGSIIWVSSTASAVYDKNGKIIRYEGSTVDITERKQAEEHYKRLLAAIENIAEAVVITDLSGNILYTNPTFEKITGYAKEEVIGENPRILKSGKQDSVFYDKLWQTITSGEIWYGRFIDRKKNGSFYTEDTTISPVFNESGGIINFVAVKRDITNDIMMERKLQQSQKMESIGVLAGGIAHDFNNILFPIIGYTEMMMRDAEEDHPWKNRLNSIYKSCLRASDLVKQILTFARQEKSDTKLMKMQPIIKEALKLIRSTIPATIEIKQNINPKCGAIKVDPTQIHQIVMNLTTNAYHAMEDTGGKMTVSLKEIHLDKDDAQQSSGDMNPGYYACLSVTDTGIGMDKTIIENIFTPFFTTKEKGKGTGMGLSVVHGIVKKAGGSINVYSEPGKGTTFNVYLPVIESDSYESSSTVTDSPVPRGTGHILLVDDENEILKMEKDVLEHLGYQVTSRNSSTEALELFKNSFHKFDLVITDLVMPNMPGDKLAAELLKLRPDIPILLCTGFSEVMSEEKAASMGIHGFLLKPVVIKDLAKKIGEVLNGKKATDDLHDIEKITQ